MFDLVAGKSAHVPSTPAIPIVISSTVQAGALAVIAVASLLLAGSRVPAVPSMLAFVREMPVAPAPPPPPPPAVAATPRPAAAVSKQAPTLTPAAPIEAPRRIELETLAPSEGDEEGVPGGVEGGITGGIAGGIPALVEGPPPPPPAAPPRPEIARVGGQLQVPALIRRVEPIYPGVAQSASIDGVVILDAVVSGDGRVQAVTVLRGHPLLAKAAIEAVRQWQYEPLLLNGVATPFELTVSLWFHFTDTHR